MGMKVLCINPGSTSTRIAVFDENENIFTANVTHSNEELEKFGSIQNQLQYRYDLILKCLKDEHIELEKLNGVVGRGGALRPMAGGVFSINESMLKDCRSGKYAEHPSNLGCQLAVLFAEKYHLPSFVVDPPLIDEFGEEARPSGYKGIERKSAFHALNEKAVAHFIAEKLGKSMEEIHVVTTHLGSGISVTAHSGGKCVDNTYGSGGDGPFSPERSGRLPALELLKAMDEHKEMAAAQWKSAFSKKSGYVSYLGTNDVLRIQDMAEKDLYVKDVMDSMIYAIAKEMSAYCTILNWDVDAFGITGAIARSTYITGKLKAYLTPIAPVYIYPGEYEMEALASGGIRALKGEEQVKEY